MSKPIFTIFDNKKGSYGAPFIHTNQATAVRDFSQAINNVDGMKFAPADFNLYYIGDFNEDTGVIEPIEPTEFICNGVSVFNEK